MKKKSGLSIEILKSMPEELREALHEVFQEEYLRSESMKMEIGTLSPELIASLVKIEQDHQDLKEQIDRKIQDAMKQIEREYDPMMTEMKRRDQEFWKEVYRQFGSDKGKNHSINRITGVVSVEIEDDPVLNFSRIVQ